MVFNFEAYEKYVKPAEVVVEPHKEEPDKLFNIEDDAPPAPQVVIPDDMKANLMAELREQILKELEGNKTKEE